jgi:hypothetical protein
MRTGDKAAKAKSPAELVAEAAGKNQGKVLADLLRDHPTLTRDEAEKMLKEAGH